MARCADCGTTTDVRSYGLCLPCNVARGRAECAAQGVEFTVTDPALLDRIATLVRPSTREAA